MSLWMRGLLVLGALLLGCRNAAAPPSPEDVARRLPEFYFQALPITGLYLNHDTDGIIFRYSISESEQPAWIQRLKDAARANGWEVIHEGGPGAVDSLHLRRIDDPRHRYRDEHSLELVRIIPCGEVLLIGAIQADLKEQSELAAVSADGPDWYRTTFWPLLVKYQAEACGIRESLNGPGRWEPLSAKPGSTGFDARSAIRSTRPGRRSATASSPIVRRAS